MEFKAISVAAALSTLIAMPVAAQDRDGWPSNINIGTGSQGGTYVTYGSGFGAMISADLGVTAGVEITGGPVQNVTLVETGEHRLGFVTLGPSDPPEDLRTVSLWNFAITHKDMPGNLGFAIAALAMENHDRMVTAQAAAKKTLAENVLRNAVIPFHPGAVQWFEEKSYQIPDSLK